jgi:hypothetical protein
LRTLTTKATALTLGEATPDTELLAIRQCVFKALATNNAALADFFGFTGAGTALGEEQIGVDSKAVGGVLPATFLAKGLSVSVHVCLPAWGRSDSPKGHRLATL